MKRIIWTWLFLPVLAMGCAGEGDNGNPDGGDPLPVPHVSALSATTVSVGHELAFEGSGFMNDVRGWTRIKFRGEFHAEDGSVENVLLTIDPQWKSEARVVWPSFGPYRIPFGRAGNKLGTFRGEVVAINMGMDQTHQVPDPAARDFEITVGPSLIVRDFMPRDAGCMDIPANLINMLRYEMAVEAVGFTPAEFSYTISSGLIESADDPTLGREEPTSIVHPAEGLLDVIGVNDDLAFAQVPYAIDSYRASINVIATADDGSEHAGFFMFSVHNPLEIYYTGKVVPAEIYVPVPVSSCIPGGINGRTLTYNETHTETRSRSLATTWQHQWTTGYNESYTENYTDGDTESNRVGFSTTDGVNWNWEVHGEVYGEGGVNLVAQGKAGFKAGGGFGGGGEHSAQRSNEYITSASHTYGEARQQSTEYRETEGEMETTQWSVSTTDSTLMGFSAQLLPHQYGVFYRQTTRLVRDASVLAYDLCGNPVNVGDLVLNDWTWAPDLAMDAACPPFPEPQLPVAQCLVPPCGIQ